MAIRARLKLPKEHGAWAMLYVPLVVGLLVAGRFPLRVVLLLLSATFLFIGRESLSAWWRAFRRRRSAGDAKRLTLVYISLAVLFAAPLVLFYRLYLLIPFGLLTAALLGTNAEQSALRKDRSTVGEIMAIIGLAGSAAASHYVALGDFRITALWLWLLSALYFASSVFFVKMLVKSAHSREEQDRKRAWWQCALYHSFLIAILAGLSLGAAVGPLILVAFLPVLVRAVWYLTRPVRELNLKRVGVLEILYSLVFMAFAALTFRVH